MKKNILFLLFIPCFKITVAQFAPPAGQIGTTAMSKDSAAFISWALGCTVSQGFQDISDTTLGYASVGTGSAALGIAGTNGVVSLGDGGSAILTFINPITDGVGYDFAVFENSFSDTFLELGFVEVSSDGINFFRFPATSNTQDTLQVNGFGSIDATAINNFAGKYRALYGTPFDLQELSSLPGLNISHITHVKIIDVIGSINPIYATFDQYGKKVNDPWNTPFASGGFDLDAVGVIHEQTAGVENNDFVISDFSIYPNPIQANSTLQYNLIQNSLVSFSINDVRGKELYRKNKFEQQTGWNSFSIELPEMCNGIYYLQLNVNGKTISHKIIYIK